MTGLRQRLGTGAIASLVVMLSGIGSAQAQDAATPTGTKASPALSLELNALEQVENACRLTFVITNRLGMALDRAAFEFAVFDKRGIVDRLTVLDFKDLADKRTKVSRFDLPNAQCGELGRILVNAANACSGAGVDPDACLDSLETTARAEIEFGS